MSISRIREVIMNQGDPSPSDAAKDQSRLLTNADIEALRGINGNIQAQLVNKQDILRSGSNIKTINNQSILGGGNLTISSETYWGDILGNIIDQTDLVVALSAKQDLLVNQVNIKSINGISLLGSGNITVGGGGGSGTVTSVAMTVPTGLSVSPATITSSGTFAITYAAGYALPTTASQANWDTAYTNRITSLTTTGSSGAATLVSNVLNIPNYGSALTGYVPYTGATTNVNLGTHQLLAARGTFSNNGSTNTLTVDHTSGSGYGIVVTKGGSNEALYVNKTSGSGNAMTVVGGRTSLVDLALSSVSNAAGDFLTLSGGVVHRRTAAQVLSDISVPTPTLAQVTTAGNTTTNSITIGGLTVDTNTLYVDSTNNRVGVGTTTPTASLQVIGTNIALRATLASGDGGIISNDATTSYFQALTVGNAARDIGISGKEVIFKSGTVYSESMRIFSSRNVAIGTNVDNVYKLNVNGDVNSTSYFVNGVAGYTGMLVIPTNPPGQQNIDIQGGIIVNVF